MIFSIYESFMLAPVQVMEGSRKKSPNNTSSHQFKGWICFITSLLNVSMLLKQKRQTSAIKGSRESLPSSWYGNHSWI